MFKGTILNPALRKSAFKNQRGFILGEVAMGMIVLGLIGVATHQSLKRFERWSRAEITKKNQETVWHNLEAYLSHHGRLPFACFLEDQGIEHTSLAVGYVPYATLGLMPSSVKDGDGHWIIYAVDRHWTAEGHGERRAICQSLYQKKSTIELNYNGQSVLSQKTNSPTKAHNGVAAILFSGKNYENAFKEMPYKIIVSYKTSPYERFSWKTRYMMTKAAEIHCFDTFFNDAILNTTPSDNRFFPPPKADVKHTR